MLRASQLDGMGQRNETRPAMKGIDMCTDITLWQLYKGMAMHALISSGHMDARGGVEREADFCATAMIVNCVTSKNEQAAVGDTQKQVAEARNERDYFQRIVQRVCNELNLSTTLGSVRLIPGTGATGDAGTQAIGGAVKSLVDQVNAMRNIVE